MAVRVSRRKLAAHTARQIEAESQTALAELAAYLVDTGRTREADMIVRDIEAALADNGTVVASVVSAQALTDAARKDVTDLIASRYDYDITVQLREAVDPNVLGGVIVRTPREEVDASVRHALAQLKATKIKE